ncbi:E3 ubiquitin-protein ligase RSL1-like [Lycium ferocissimum]|uniref:E3 ubiquitin-protein ligase RSL1-like n=1 Tax=Lycium ferocissimum TaxID=112874 RepID=UPI00281603F7|nr:E3 ubiquitin-protein ligase RSL1-like [Lycium ferocissimum]
MDSEELKALAAEQRRQLTAARDITSDFDFAFQLQLEEAINASISIQPSTSTTPPTQPPKPENDTVSKYLQLELPQLEHEIGDLELCELEFRKMRDDLNRRIHDQKVAQEILRMPEDEWDNNGDNFEVPFGEGTSKNNDENEVFRVYFKGLLGEKEGDCLVSGGIGVAICDSSDELLFELRKPYYGSGMNRQCIEFKALTEGLNAAIALDLKRVVFFCDYFPIFQFVTGRWKAKQRKAAALLNQVALLRQKFSFCQPSLVPRNEIKFAFRFAREAMTSQIKKVAESDASRKVYETCVICLEDTDIGQIFSVDGCKHRYCVSCMKQHVEVKLLHGILPKCPHAECNSDLKLDSCSKILTPKLIDIMKQHIKEASIPVTEKVYCPYPKCSALMSKSEVLEYSNGSFLGAERLGIRKCTKCNGLFCINCKVPWHYNIACDEYRRRNPTPPEDVKLKTLAATNLWRQCVKCNHMIELAAGCYHMTCRCGYEFCYTCGAPWKDKKASCSCKLWDVDYILDSDEDEDEDEDDGDDYVYDGNYDTDSDDYY